MLIVPNPESSLNEEAGRLMLERYDDYFKKAKLFTSIHAKQIQKAVVITNSEKETSVESKGMINFHVLKLFIFRCLPTCLFFKLVIYFKPIFNSSNLLLDKENQDSVNTTKSDTPIQKTESASVAAKKKPTTTTKRTGAKRL